MRTLVEVKNCLECGDTINGRSDKKFCSDQCRVTYHNRLNGEVVNLIRNINYTIRKNRRILLRLHTRGRTLVAREELIQNGFDFNYFTSLCKTKEGAVCYYCYEQGYLPMEREHYLLVFKEEHIT